jgi:hypothetical protein
MHGRVEETGRCIEEWKKLVVVRESGRNWWKHGRVKEIDGCMGGWKKPVDAL